jgi:hypothetical protein
VRYAKDFAQLMHVLHMARVNHTLTCVSHAKHMLQQPAENRIKKTHKPKPLPKPLSDLLALNCAAQICFDAQHSQACTPLLCAKNKDNSTYMA